MGCVIVVVVTRMLVDATCDVIIFCGVVWITDYVMEDWLF